MGNLKPDAEVANAASSAAVAGDWSHDIPSIRGLMKQECVAYVATVPEVAEYILQ